jgi:hypothetical protein
LSLAERALLAAGAGPLLLRRSAPLRLETVLPGDVRDIVSPFLADG